MQSVSNNLTSEQLRQDQYYTRTVEVYKRYWNGSAYVWEATPTIVDEYVKDISIVKWKLDVTNFNEWKASNFQIVLTNTRNYFSEIEPNGFWNTGSNAPYIPTMTKIRIKIGQKLEDGSIEELYIITGLIDKALNFNEEDNTVQIDCIGLDAYLAKTPVDLYSTKITNEYRGIFPWDTNSIQTYHTNVLEITRVYHVPTAQTLKENVDYTVSNLGVKDARATITFKNIEITEDAPQSIHFYIDYKIAHTDKDPSWVVEQLLQSAGITSYTVEDTEFDNSYEIYEDQTNSDYLKEGTTKTNIDIYDNAVKIGLQLFDDFSDDDYTNNPTWTAYGASTVPGYGVDVVDKKMQLRKVQHVKANSTTAVGTWEIKLKIKNCAIYIYFMSTYGYGSSSDIGYHIEYAPSIGNLRLVKDTGSTSTILGESAVEISDDEWFTIRITRDSSGNTNVYLNGVLKVSATDNTYTTTNYFLIREAATTTSKAYETLVDYVAIDSNVVAAGSYKSSAIYESKVIDGGAGLESWNRFKYTLSGSYIGTTYKIETYTSDTSDFSSGNDPNGWVEITYGTTGTINSVAKRYLKYRITLTSTGGATRTLRDLRIYYSTKSAKIPILYIRNMNTLAAIRAIASMVSYEIGFDVDDSYFYRKRTTIGDPVLEIDAKTNLEKELLYDTGIDKIYNKVRVTYGIYKEEVDSNTEGETAPTSIDKYGERLYTLSGASFLTNDTANFSLAIAKAIYSYASTPKKRVKVRIKLLAQLQLGDKVKYLREHKFGRWLWGDTDRTYGDESDPDFVYYSDPDTNGWNIVMRIEGIEFDIENARMTLDLVEV